MDRTRPLVAVVMGSPSDREAMEGASSVLEELGIPFEVKTLSAHRTPEATRDYAMTVEDRGIEAVIAGAGWAAHLAGVLAAYTTLPVIGVPLDSSPLKGMDALLATVQMPPGIPVATVAIGKGGARNAAVLAGEILALKYPKIRARLKQYRQDLTRKVMGGGS